jgi:tetratricopeptide (TPR) repeat protein
MADEEARKRLLREARAAAALDHPNICTIHEVGDEAGRNFIVMQYIEGETLSARLRRGPLSVRAALDLAYGIATALDAAHRRGVIHRDLKPQNIMITTSGAAKLLDFGIARLQPLRGEDPNARTSTELEPLRLAGTPAYMAPEVLQGRPADARSDLFSMGVVLYECLTGAQPFRGHTPHEVWGRVLHVEPEAPSRANVAVNPDIDAFCQRLLAKEPGSRFQSAAEVCGSLLVLRTHTDQALPTPVLPRRPVARRALAAGLAVAALAAVAVWWSAPSALPPVPTAAQEWYTRGIDAVRQGAYVTGRKALEEAIRLHPGYALAHSRLAEVLSALDEEGAAQASLIRVSGLVPDQSRLPPEDRLRLDAIRATVLRDLDRATEAYTALAKARPTDAGALVDLGRAQEAAGNLADARVSYERAIAIDAQFAAGFLRLGSVLGDAGDVAGATRALDEASRLYTLASSEEGRVETLLQRAAMLDAAGRFEETATAADEAMQIAQQAGLTAQEIRAGFIHASALVGRGAFADGEVAVRTFVDRAMAAGLQGVAADGLTDLAGTLLVRDRLDEAESAVVRAIAIAQERSLTRTAMNAATQRASIAVQRGRPRDALAFLDEPLKYFAQSRHRRLEAVALTLGARAHQQLGEYSEARELASRVLQFASTNKNPELTAQSLATLSTLAAIEGRLVEALQHRERATAIRRDLNDTETLPFDLTNRAEILIRLGRAAEAEATLREVDAGIRSGRGAFPTRVRRVAFLRALSALIDERFDAAREFAEAVERAEPGRTDDTAQSGRMLASVAAAHMTRRGPVARLEADADADSPTGRELRLWRAAALLAVGDPTAAAADLDAVLGVTDSVGGDELQFRAAGLAAMAAAARADQNRASSRARQAAASLERMREAWTREHAEPYERRRDIQRILSAVQRIVSSSVGRAGS